jgi:peptidoglycan/LPS O-acetylase OafA/YrhL
MHRVTGLFWALALGAIVCYAFFAALGAFAPGDVAAVTIVVAVLAVLSIIHAWMVRARGADRDPELRGARERRGF